MLPTSMNANIGRKMPANYTLSQATVRPYIHETNRLMSRSLSRFPEPSLLMSRSSSRIHEPVHASLRSVMAPDLGMNEAMLSSSVSSYQDSHWGQSGFQPHPLPVAPGVGYAPTHQIFGAKKKTLVSCFRAICAVGAVAAILYVSFSDSWDKLAGTRDRRDALLSSSISRAKADEIITEQERTTSGKVAVTLASTIKAIDRALTEVDATLKPHYFDEELRNAGSRIGIEAIHVIPQTLTRQNVPTVRNTGGDDYEIDVMLKMDGAGVAGNRSSTIPFIGKTITCVAPMLEMKTSLFITASRAKTLSLQSIKVVMPITMQCSGFLQNIIFSENAKEVLFKDIGVGYFHKFVSLELEYLLKKALGKTVLVE